MKKETEKKLQPPNTARIRSSTKMIDENIFPAVI
jgi:hypothetical protein